MTCKTSPKKIACPCGRRIRGNAYFLHARKCVQNPMYGSQSRREIKRRQNSLIQTLVVYPYFKTKCEHCGWSGSSEQVILNRYFDDADCVCPACKKIFLANEIV